MEHTVEAYLERCSSEKLIDFLKNCMDSNEWEQQMQIIPKIITILHNRNVSVPEQIQQSWENINRTCASK